MDPTVVAKAIIIQHLDSDPLRSRRHTNGLTRSSLLAHRQTSHVGAMAVAVHGVVVALFGGAPPIAGVDGQPPLLIPPVPRLKCGVLPVHAGIHDGHGSAPTIHTQGAPDQVGPHSDDVPLRGAIPPAGMLLGYSEGFHPAAPAILADEAHLGSSRHRHQRFGVGRHCQPIKDPEGLDLRPMALPLTVLQEGQEFCLALLGRGLQLAHYLAAAIDAGKAGIQQGQVGLRSHLHDKAVLLVRVALEHLL